MFKEIVLLLNIILFVIFSFLFIKGGIGNLQYWWEYLLSFMVILVPVLNIIALKKDGIKIPKLKKENQFAVGIATVLILGLTITGYSYYTNYVRNKMLAFKDCIEPCGCPFNLPYSGIIPCNDFQCQMECQEEHGISVLEFTKWMSQ